MDGPTVRVEMRFKNARLYREIESCTQPDKHYGIVRKFCREHELSYPDVHGLLTLRGSPLAANKTVRPTAERLCKLFGIHADDLFPAELYRIVWPRKLVREVEASRFVALGAAPRAALMLEAPQDDELQGQQLKEALRSALDTLPRRSQLMVTAYYGLDGGEESTCEKVGEQFAVTPERVRQVLIKALRSLRHPTRARLLKPFIYG